MGIDHVHHAPCGHGGKILVLGILADCHDSKKSIKIKKKTYIKKEEWI